MTGEEARMPAVLEQGPQYWAYRVLPRQQTEMLQEGSGRVNPEQVKRAGALITEQVQPASMESLEQYEVCPVVEKVAGMKA